MKNAAAQQRRREGMKCILVAQRDVDFPVAAPADAVRAVDRPGEISDSRFQRRAPNVCRAMASFPMEHV
jgi:hypothetical protein